MAWDERLRSRLGELLGPAGLDDGAAARRVYARDASHLTLGQPLAVLLPATEEDLRRSLALCAAAGVPVVCRGSGTGLSGGAVPPDGAVVLSTARLTALGPVDRDLRIVRSQPGVLNTVVSRHAASCGLHFAPDPSSQAASSIGGNIAENAGGPHCLSLGVTLQHLRGLEWADAQGRGWSTGGAAAVRRGVDLQSLLCGSEGTLGVVTAAQLGLTPDPAAVATLLCIFPRLEDAAGSVPLLLGAGLLPVAMEIVDQPMLQAVEQAFAFGFPTDVEAAMVLEFAGAAPETAADAGRAGRLLLGAGAREVRQAADEDERLRLWQCRKRAFGAVGRLSPSYVTMDVVVPLGELAPLVREIQEIRARHGVNIATAFHAGDGNLHPGVHYDDRDPEAARRAHAAADEIIRAALRRGGSATGEHGVGVEKLHAMPWQLDAVTAELLRGVKQVFDPQGLLNPGKVLPADDAEWAPAPQAPAAVDFAWDSLTVTAPADARLGEIQAAALERGFWVPVGLTAGAASTGLGRDASVAELVDHLLTGPPLLAGGAARDFLLELWARTGDGRPLHCGAPVFKNVAGYDLVHALCGAGGVLAEVRAATFQLRPAPAVACRWDFRGPAGDGVGRLAGLFRLLAARATRLTAPTLILDGDSGSVTVLASGRSEPWDLPPFGVVVAEAAAAAGFAPAGEEQAPFAAAAERLACGLPDWVTAAADWSLLAPEGEGAVWLPAGTRRAVWHAAPLSAWVPRAVRAERGFHVEAFLQGGRPGPLPAPPQGTPVHVLQGLKALFDPQGRLPRPAWLQEAPHD